MPWALLYLLPVVFLCGCQNQGAREEAARLQQRVTKLEREVAQLKKGERAPTEGGGPTTAQLAQIAARACTQAVAQTMEEYRRRSLDNRYPRKEEWTPPTNCAEFKLEWAKLTAQSYHLRVLGADGRVAAEVQR